MSVKELVISNILIMTKMYVRQVYDDKIKIEIDSDEAGESLGLGEARQLIADNCKQWNETKAKEYATDAWLDYGGK